MDAPEVVPPFDVHGAHGQHVRVTALAGGALEVVTHAGATRTLTVAAGETPRVLVRELVSGPAVRLLVRLL